MQIIKNIIIFTLNFVLLLLFFFIKIIRDVQIGKLIIDVMYLNIKLMIFKALQLVMWTIYFISINSNILLNMNA